jgi:predicted DNA-binding WGR domain protein
MRRFEFKDGKSNKFWEIQVEGDSHTVRYGKIGTDGQVQTKTFASDAKAQADADKLIASKTKKGYVEVAVDKKTQAQAKAKTAPAGARNPELEAAITADSGDLAAWQVYFDWLQTQGDPWGERGNLAIARDKAKGAAKTKLTKQIEAFDEEHGEALYGKALLALMKKDDYGQVAEIGERYGLIWTARVRSPEYEWEGTAPGTVLGALVKSSAARLIYEIRIGLTEQDPGGMQKGIDAMSKAGKLDSLQSLMVGDFEFPDETEISWVEDTNVAKLLPVAPNLRELHVRGGGISLGKLEHTTLQKLTIETGGLHSTAVASVGKCKLPELTSMEVWLGTENYGGSGSVKQLAELFKGTNVPKLVHLGLRNSDFEDDIAVALCKSDLLPRLQTVDLSMGTMHGDGVEAIIANAAKFKHLKKLDLSDNFLSDDQVKRVKKALGKIVDTSGQRRPYEWNPGELRYYTSVGE